MAQILRRVANTGSAGDFLPVADTQGAFAPNPNNKYIGPPDTDRIGTVNLLSPTIGSGTCTISEDGHVVCGSTTTSGVRYVVVSINGKQMALQGMPGDNNGPIRIPPLPVKKGDIVTVGAAGPANQGIYCYFVPPRYTEFPVITNGLVQSSGENGKVSIDPVTREMTLNGYPFVPMMMGGIASYAPTNKTYWPANASVTSASPLLGPWFGFTVPVYLTLSLYSNSAGNGIGYALDVENVRTGIIADPYSVGVMDGASGVFIRGQGMLLPANIRARIRVFCTASGSVSWGPTNSNGGLLLVSGVSVVPLYGA
jgi:hypothetical protein